MMTTATGQPTNAEPGQNLGGAPVGNHNRSTYGLSTVSRQPLRYSLPSPRLPKAYNSISVKVDVFRRELEDAVQDVYGTVSLTHAGIIQSACDHERARQFLYRRLRDREDEGTVSKLETAASVFSAISKCAGLRDKCVESLKLDSASELAPWAELMLPNAPTARIPVEPTQDEQSKQQDAGQPAQHETTDHPPEQPNATQAGTRKSSEPDKPQPDNPIVFMLDTDNAAVDEILRGAGA